MSDYIHSGCDDCCPVNDTENAVKYQNYGCLPTPYEIFKMLKEGKVWMCHSDPTRPCVVTKLKTVPVNFISVTEY